MIFKHTKKRVRIYSTRDSRRGQRSDSYQHHGGHGPRKVTSRDDLANVKRHLIGSWAAFRNMPSLNWLICDIAWKVELDLNNENAIPALRYSSDGSPERLSALGPRIKPLKARKTRREIFFLPYANFGRYSFFCHR